MNSRDNSNIKESRIGVEIAGFGHYAPDRIILNAEIEAQLGLEAGWIERRTGIRSRRWVEEGQALSDIAVPAAELALKRAAIERQKIALMLLATSTPDHLLPPSAPLVAHRLGLTRAGAIDMAGACAGFVYALTMADAFVRTHRAPVLVVAANILSRRINLKERASAILFADAAGAVVLAPSERADAGVIGCGFASDGGGYDLIKIPVGGSRQPFCPGLDPSETLMSLADGRAVFQKAVAMMVDTSRAALAQAGLQISDIDHWIPHQANQRIIDAVRVRLGCSKEQGVYTVADYANSSAASIPFTLSKEAEARDYRSAQHVLFSAAGAGLTGGAVVFRL